MELWDALTQSQTLTHDTWEWDGDTFRKRSYEEIILAARHAAAGLRRRGIGPGSIVATVITNGPDATSGAMGVWLAGATLASLPIPARGMSIPAYTRQLGRLCRHLGADHLLAEERFLQFMPPGAELGVEILGYRSLVETPAMADIDPPGLDQTIFIQFSSGTTGEPRGVKLSGHAVEAQLKALSKHIRIDPERDIGYSWLPLSHDMGFFGCALLGWYTGMRGVISSPERFLQSPRTWFDDCAEFGATVTAGPPLAVDIAARAERARPGDGALALRLCLVGAEQIEWSALVNAAEAFAPRGLRMNTFTPAYGLAEATLAVTVGDLDERPRYVDVDAEALVDGIVREIAPDDPAGRRVVSVGMALPEVDLRIDQATQEVLVQSPSLTSGYFDNDALTGERLRAGELRTCDMGFVLDDELYVTGRTDDVLIVAGRNVFVQELEASIGAEPGIRRGNCAIVETPRAGRKRIALVAETASAEVDPNELARRVSKVVRERSGLVIDEFLFLPVGAFPKTPSGKVQRYRCRHLLRGEDAGVRLGSAVG
jgi:acyl-CoA synthetase (AMP-forming)/AMP-acid ligase II